MQAALSRLAPEPDPAAVSQLRARLLSRAGEMNLRSRRMAPRLVWGVGLAVVAALVIFWLAASPAAVTAMKHLLGYIPGLGLVEEGPSVRALPRPATAAREGIRVTVEQGASDGGRTILLLNVEGFPPPTNPPQPNSGAVCPGQPQLRLPDGTILPVTSGSGHGWDTGYTQRLVFPALPAGKDAVVLEIPCLIPAVPGNWPLNWQIPLTFQALDSSQLAPVIELPPAPSLAPPTPSLTVAPQTPTASGGTLQATAVGETAQPTPRPVDYGISLALEKVVELPDGYILMGDLTWTGDGITDYGVHENHVRLTDASGQEVPLEMTTPDMPGQSSIRRMLWAYKVSGKVFNGPLTLSMDNVVVNLKEQASFQFDPGPNPRPGQTWALDLEVPGKPYALHIDSVKMADSMPQQSGFLFTMHSDPDVVEAGIMDLTQPSAGGGGGGEERRGPFMGQVYYPGGLPPGPLTLTITDVSVLVDGPWQMSWTPGGK
jgi:hypothetical protein